MSLLLKNAQIFDPESAHHGNKCDILIDKGKIASLEGEKAEEVIDLDGKLVFPGWFDFNAHFNDPGFEFKEDIDSGSMVACMGGFTDVQLIPNTSPPLETKSDIKYILHRKSLLVDLHVSAALSEGLRGENLTEIYDLKNAGAVSFSDGDKSVWNSELLLKALQYTSHVNAPIIQLPRDASLSNTSQMHEGVMSTSLGLKGEPRLSEELIVMRDIEILRYSGGKIHFSRISSMNSVEMIRKAKKEGLSITCDTSIHQLMFNDTSIQDFDTNYKNLPPYRCEEDRVALIEGVMDGTIDVICSNHRPQDRESKHLEFDLADYGAIALQTFYSSLIDISREIPFDKLIRCITSGPRRVLGLANHVVETGFQAKLTVVDPDRSWILNAKTNFSKSANSPFFEKNLKGMAIGTINGDSYNFVD